MQDLIKCLSHNACHTVLVTQRFSHMLQHRSHDKQGTLNPTSSLSLAALASASAFCSSASAWCLSLLFLECTELAALLVVSRTLHEKLTKISLVITILKSKFPSLLCDYFVCNLLREFHFWSTWNYTSFTLLPSWLTLVTCLNFKKIENQLSFTKMITSLSILYMYQNYMYIQHIVLRRACWRMGAAVGGEAPSGGPGTPIYTDTMAIQGCTCTAQPGTLLPLKLWTRLQTSSPLSARGYTYGKFTLDSEKGTIFPRNPWLFTIKSQNQ